MPVPMYRGAQGEAQERATGDFWQESTGGGVKELGGRAHDAVEHSVVHLDGGADDADGDEPRPARDCRTRRHDKQEINPQIKRDVDRLHGLRSGLELGRVLLRLQLLGVAVDVGGGPFCQPPVAPQLPQWYVGSKDYTG